MKIVKVIPFEAFYIETDQECHYEYTRYSAEAWTVRMGDSDEPFYECEEIEKMFQEYNNRDKK